MSTSRMTARLKLDLAIATTYALSGDDERLFDEMIIRVIHENLRPKRESWCLDPTIQRMIFVEAISLNRS